MSVALVTGAGGLVGAAAARLFAARGLDVVGIDNDMRARLFGAAASTRAAAAALAREVDGYRHVEADIRAPEVEAVFARHGREIAIVVHAAAQPSHDWAARDPAEDFSINASATLGLLEAARRHCPDAVFIFCSTNKVYGDTPNRLGLVESETRWDLPAHDPAWSGIDEAMSLDASLHSLFGVSKAAADLMVQEYGRYFGMRTACFRCGCITGPGHAGVPLHGFLSWLVRSAVLDRPYTAFGHEAKQVRDNIHAADLAEAFWAFFRAPRASAVYNIGGGREANCSVREAIAIAERLTRRPMRWTYDPQERIGDHRWWISDTRRFRADHPGWRLTRGIEAMIAEIHDGVTAAA